MRIGPVGVEMLHVGGRTGRTDMTKPIVTFRNFTNAPKTEQHCLYTVYIWTAE